MENIPQMIKNLIGDSQGNVRETEHRNYTMTFGTKILWSFSLK